MTHGASLTWPIPCVECGKGEVAPLAKTGRVARYKTIAALPVPDDVQIPTCNACGVEWIDEKTARAVDAALEPLYQRRLREMALDDLGKLSRVHVSQRRLEGLLGLSQGYLSKVRSGASSPSPMLVGLLHLLAGDPERRLKEFEETFGGIAVRTSS